jgi:hypothetical protein
MSTARPNFMWPVLVIGVGIIMLMISANVIPEAYGDLLVRAWPVLLLLFGLNVLLAGRLPYANWVILALSIVLVVVIARFAYAQQRSKYRDDYRVSWQDIVPEGVEQIVVWIETKETRVALTHAPEPHEVLAEFTGSTESNVDIQMAIEGNTATLSIIEKRSGIIPRLAEVGRGTLNVFLPYDVRVQELHYHGDDGPVTFDLQQLGVRSLDVQIERGNMKLCLSQPVANLVTVGDQVKIDEGDLRLIIPEALAINLRPDARQLVFLPETSQDNYNFPRSGEIFSRGVLNNQFSVVLDVIVAGTLTFDHVTPCQ